MLTDIRIRTFKPEKLPARLWDGRGLYVEFAPSGAKLWRLKFRVAGKEKRLALGQYPRVSLKDARRLAEEARNELARGVDPSAARRKQRAHQRALAEPENCFATIAREWLAVKRPSGADTHATRTESRIVRLLLPALGAIPIAEISAQKALEALRTIEAQSPGEAARCRVILGQVFDYAIQVGKAMSNPARPLRGALITPKRKHFAAPTSPEALRDVLVKIKAFTSATPAVIAALTLAPLLVVRPGELRKMQWNEIDFDAAEWRFRVSKTDADHCVPLPAQAMRILKELRRESGRASTFVFPNARFNDRPMSENAVLYAMRSAGVTKEMTVGHGFRASFRTICDEVLRERIDIIEHQLGHRVKDALGRAYNRTRFLEERRQLMQRWADFLTELADQN